MRLAILFWFSVAISTSAAVGDESRGLAVIPPGYESLLGEMLGLGAELPASCRFSGAGADRTFIRSRYDCASGVAVYELRHPSVVPAAKLTTDRFALVVVEGDAPDELSTALLDRIRARETGFEWSWTPLPGAEEENSYYSSIGGAAAIASLCLAVAGFVAGLLLWSVRRGAPVRTSSSGLGSVVLASFLALAFIGCVHAALRLTGAAFGSMLQGGSPTAIALNLGGSFGLILASAVAVAGIGRFARGGLLRAWAVGLMLAYVACGYHASLLADDLHYFGSLSTYPPNTTMGESLGDGGPVTYRINGRGFRYPDFADHADDDVVRVVLIGDSFVFGIGVNYEGSLRPHLERALGQRWPGLRFEVLNVGIPGNNLASHVSMYREVTTRLSPDVVILGLTFANDLSRWDEQDARRDARRYGAYSFVRFLIGDSVESLWALVNLERETTQAGLDHLDRELQRLGGIRKESSGQPLLVLFGFQPWDPPVAARVRRVPNAILVPNRTTQADEFIPGDGHPTSVGNERSAQHIAKTLAAEPMWQSLLEAR